ncbi:ArsA family ATPase [Nakamurella flava]|uniref:ArsA family ATPase n=1 Tax=Nakamurella flava TaxID=2576308 RepID=UPI00197BBE3B|nr:ArsA family ATPase [Nakamurella flava]
MSGLRVVLHTGKGGVGKTTVSCATAVACARRGLRTLLLSTDPAHSVADVLDVPVSGDPEPVPGQPDLWAAQVDTRHRFEESWAQIRAYLVGVLAARGMAEVQAEELTVLPGAEEVVALLELRRLAASGRFDVIVVDCAPTGETLRLLALPETIGFYAGRLLGAPQRMLRSLAATFTGVPGSAPSAAVRDAVGELLTELMAARALLADPQVTGIRLVLTPERVVIAEARRLFTALSLHGFTVEGATINRVLPPKAGGEFLRGQRAAQREALVHVRESFAGLTVRRVPMVAREPVGVAALAELADEIFAADDPLARTTEPTHIQVEGADGRYQLALPLPLVDKGDLALSRSGDDLVVTVGDVRRRMALPSVLRRCTVGGARFDGGRLLVEFVADPDLWPATLRARVLSETDGGSPSGLVSQTRSDDDRPADRLVGA